MLIHTMSSYLNSFRLPENGDIGTCNTNSGSDTMFGDRSTLAVFRQGNATLKRSMGRPYMLSKSRRKNGAAMFAS